jgi:hypothetical protein
MGGYLMPAVAFDTLKFANKLKEAGVPDKQAEAQASTFAEMLEVNLKDLATKSDLQSIKGEIQTIKNEIKSELQEVKTAIEHRTQEIRQELKQVETRLNGDIFLVKWMIGTCFTAVVAVLIRLFFFRLP